MNPRVTDRDIAPPKQWGPAGPGRVWHHVIPFWLLRDVWNRLVDLQIETELPEVRIAIRQYLLLADPGLRADIDKLIDRMRAENKDQERTRHHNLHPLDEVEIHRLGQAATWPVWNAVEGPRLRSDDPHDRYFDRFTAGLTVEEAARMKAIEILFGQFQSFVGASASAPGPALRALAQAASNARPFLRCNEPIRYRPEMWVLDRDTGTWHKKRDRERDNPAA